MQKKIIYFIVILFVTAGMTYAETSLIIKSGKKKSVGFPHQKHQKMMSCAKCHNLFDKKKDSIQALIEKKKLKKKEVMAVCLKCHREMKRENKKTGPTSCVKCHNN